MVVHEHYLGRIQSGMDVCDSRGSRLGSVARVYRYDSHDEPDEHAGGGTATAVGYDEVLEVKTGMLGLGKRLYVPFSSIQEIVSDSVFLSIGGFDSELDQFKHRPEYLDKLH
ncbi:MAG: hypothetical protein JOZ87_10495 [Chloroflexi bacterium]|nr:hypothetical protein [Chloroflexota bacterium]